MDFNDFRQRTKLFIRFGSACNGTCKYCTQGNTHIGMPHRKVSDAVVEWVVKWSRYVEKPIVIFYGGEPLLYWKEAMDFVERLKAAGVDERTDFWTTTNGLLLNEEIVADMNRLNMEVSLSYDGQHIRKTRGMAISEEQEKLFLKINRRNIMCVVNAYDWDFVANRLFLEKKFPGCEIIGNMITATWDIPEKLYAFDWQRMEQMLRRLITYYKVHPLDFSFNTLIWGYINERSDWDDFVASGYSSCAIGIRNLAMDIDGNFLFCNNTGEKICDITKSYEEIMQSYSNSISSKTLICKSCDVYEQCRCHCPLAEERDGRYTYCGYLRRWIKLLSKHKAELYALRRRGW